MKRCRIAVIFSILLAMLCMVGCADSPPERAKNVLYSDEVRLVHKYQDGDVVFLGDERLRCCNWQGVIQGVRIVNSANAEQTIAVELAQVNERFGDKEPSKVVLMMGYNDLDKGMPANEVFKMFAEYVDTLSKLQPQTEIVIVAQLPVGDFLRYGYQKVTNEVLDAYNVMVKIYAAEKNIQVVDLNAKFKDDNGVLKDEYDAQDGFHLYPAAYEVLGYYLNGILN